MAVNPLDPYNVKIVDPNNPPLAPGEEDNEIAVWQSIAAGVGSGLIKAVGSTVSLAAELIDLGLDTDKAADVEEFFDNLNPFEEAAEETLAGKMTQTIAQLAIPGTAAFKLASGAMKAKQLAATAIKAKKAGNYLEKGNAINALRAVKNAEKTFNRKNFFAGVAGGTAAEFAVFDEDIGTFGEAFDIGPTKLKKEELYGRENALQSLVNRTKFGAESILLTGAIAGVGSTAKLLANHGKELIHSNNAMFRFIDKYVGAPFRARKDLPPEAFEIERSFLGKKSATTRQATRVVNNLNQSINNLYGGFWNTLSAADKVRRKEIINQIGEVVTSGESRLMPHPTKEGVELLEFGGTMKEPLQGFEQAQVTKLKDLLKGLPGEKNWDHLYQSMYHTRLLADDVRNAFYQTELVQKAAGPEYKELVKSQLGSFFESSYALGETKNLWKWLQYRPTNSTIRTAVTELQKASASNPILRQAYNGAMSEGQALAIVDDLFNASKIEFGVVDDVADYMLKTFPRKARPFETANALRVNFNAPTQAASTEIQQLMLKNPALKKLLGPTGDIRVKLFNTVETLTNYTTKLNMQRKIASSIDDAEAAFGLTKDAQYMTGFRGAVTDAARDLPIGFSSADAARKIMGEGTRIPSATVKVNQELIPQLGKDVVRSEFNALENYVFHKEVADALSQQNAQWFTGSSPVLKLYRNLILFPKATSQIAKTILSPITHMRNLLSAAAFSTANGVFPLIPTSPSDYTIFAKAMKDSFQVLSKRNVLANPKAAQNFYDELLELGVVNSNVRLGDLSGLLDDIGLGGTRMLGESSFNRLTKGMNNLYKWAEDKYIMEDDFWKIINFGAEKGKLLRAYGGRLPAFKNPFTGATESFNAHVARIVRNTVPNYDYVGSFIRGLRSTPFGNFVAFPAEIIRTGANVIRQSIREMAPMGKIDFKNPTFGIGLNRLINANATFIGLPLGLYEGAKALYDVSEDEMKALRRIVPGWSTNSTLIPLGRDENDNIRYIDYSHANAFDTLIRPAQTVLNNIVKGEQNGEALLGSMMRGMIEAASEVAEPFIQESLFYEAANDILSRGGKSREGRTIYDETDLPGDKITKIIAHLLKTQAPGSIAQLNRILRSASEDPNVGTFTKYDKYGRDFETWDEVRGIFGYRVIVADPNRVLPYKITSYRRTVDRTKGPINRVVYRGGPIDPVNLVEAVLKANKSKYILDRKFYNDLDALKTLGVDNNALNVQMKRIRGVNNQRALTAGKFIPVQLTRSDIQQIWKRTRELGLSTNPYLQARDQIMNIYRDLMGIPLRETSIEAETNVDDIVSDIKARTKDESSFLPEIFTRDLATPAASEEVISADPLNITLPPIQANQKKALLPPAYHEMIDRQVAQGNMQNQNIGQG